jgi:CheY-like chemotaxis protein
MAREYYPGAVCLDIHLPDIDGWRVLSRLKKDPATRHVPVFVVSTDDARERALAAGALAFLAKPIQSKDVLDGLLDYVSRYVNRATRRVLLVDPDRSRREDLAARLTAPEVEINSVEEASSIVATAIDHLADCLIVAGSEAGQLCERLAATDSSSDPVQTRLPVIVFEEGQSNSEEDGRWRRLGDVCTVRTAHSIESVLDLAAFHLHRPLSKLPEAQRERLLGLDQSNGLLAGRKVLIVDDDMRNIFALSTILEEHDAVIVSADNGRDAIRILRADSEVEVVLMDIMMPEMDGMETIREIRKISSLKNLPIVAVTAKAMKGDREKCIEAGAWDYLSKPVDTDQLLSVLRGWLNR